MQKLPPEIRAEVEKAQMFVVDPNRTSEASREMNNRENKGMDVAHRLDVGGAKGYSER